MPESIIRPKNIHWDIVIPYFMKGNTWATSNCFFTFNIPIQREYFIDLWPIIDEYGDLSSRIEILWMAYSEFRADLYRG